MKRLIVIDLVIVNGLLVALLFGAFYERKAEVPGEIETRDMVVKGGEGSFGSLGTHGLLLSSTEQHARVSLFTNPVLMFGVTGGRTHMSDGGGSMGNWFSLSDSGGRSTALTLTADSLRGAGLSLVSSADFTTLSSESVLITRRTHDTASGPAKAGSIVSYDLAGSLGWTALGTSVRTQWAQQGRNGVTVHVKVGPAQYDLAWPPVDSVAHSE